MQGWRRLHAGFSAGPWRGRGGVRGAGGGAAAPTRLGMRPTVAAGGARPVDRAPGHTPDEVGADQRARTAVMSAVVASRGPDW